MQTVVTLTGYKSFEGTNARGPWKKNVFTASDGKEFYTFDAVLAGHANSLLVSGQSAAVEYEEELRDGKYTNYKLTKVEAANTTNGSSTFTSAQPFITPASDPRPQPFNETGKDDRIARAVALKAAIEIFTAIGQDPLLFRGEMLEYAETLLPWLLTGVDVSIKETVEA